MAYALRDRAGMARMALGATRSGAALSLVLAALGCARPPVTFEVAEAAALAESSASRSLRVIALAQRHLGARYVWGGSGPAGFDCSGLVMYVYAQVGVSLPHSSYAQFNMGTPVGISQLEPGDLVFFTGASHVGIYIGGGQVIHAPHTGDVVKLS